MNRINPLYIIGLFLVLVLISFISLSNQKNLFYNKKNQLSDLEIRFKEYYDISNFWKNEKYINETIDEILNSSLLKDEDIVKIVTKDNIKLKLETASEQNLDSFLNMILNKQLIIKKLEIKRTMVNVEIGLR
ncbi:hypothetical protein [Aliarcobacter butzleri]|uniref:hypothetical protein n=1 Tax=Aliarcobacter butzleri TaxID=28197 RepID=UPI001EDACB55|nr:hypothetical protein [Aliarcobacter butzleri]MCG3684464.1 hypothetical protein [Aliarcobacter butzleri]MCG3686928.1 hypothetical protein [Aliarcobacter butzleri]MCT7633667.1 hypothetical protein [Aliarcobacter butzleri]